MSYHQGAGAPPAPPQAPVPYPTYPLPQASAPAPLAAPTAELPKKMDPMMKALVVVLAIGLALYLFDLLMQQRKEEPVKRNPGRKMSTREMAKKLYERLEKKGNINETTMRSLSQLGRSK